jgi:hypothetical protein
VAGDGDVVIGGEEGDQAEDQPAAGLDGTEPIEAGPGALEIGEVWRSWGLLAVREGARGAWSDRGHGAEEATGSAGLPLLCSTADLPVQEATLPGTRPSGVVGILLFPWLRSHQGEEGLQSGGKQS